VLVASSFDTPITGKAADLVEAARTAFNAAIRLIKPGAATAMSNRAGLWCLVQLVMHLQVDTDAAIRLIKPGA
jgi:hypothetical protein